MAEVRVAMEGTLRFVQQSGSGRALATAATPVSGLIGYCQDFSFTSAQTITVISDRGRPDHNKQTEVMPIDINFSMLWTGTHAIPASGAGASVPMYILEFRANEPENGASGRYFQFMGCPIHSTDFKESKEGDTITWKTKALAMSGVNNSGFIV